MLIVYKSISGFTEKYANLIAKELNTKTIKLKEVNKKTIENEDLIIFGSRVHAGLIDGLKKIKKIIAKTKKEIKLVIFVTGGTPNEAEELIDKIWMNNLSVEEIESIPHFYMQGGICYEKLGKIDRFIMKTVSKMMEKKKDKDDIENGFLNSISESYDISDEKYINDLVNYIKK